MLDIDNEKLKKGYVRLFRALKDWEWFTDVNVCHLFIYCLLRANHSDTSWRGINIQRGSFITSLKTLSSETGLSTRQVRTALEKLKMTGELTQETTSQNSIITVNNWTLYQTSDTQSDKQATSQRQTSDKRATHDNNVNNVNNENNENNSIEETQTFNKSLYDPYYSPEVTYFLDTFKAQCKKGVSISPNDRINLSNALYDLVINQGQDLKELTDRFCKNFNSMDWSKIGKSTSLNWCLKEDKFYGVLNGQYNKALTADEQFYQEMLEKEMRENGN